MGWLIGTPRLTSSINNYERRASRSLAPVLGHYSAVPRSCWKWKTQKAWHDLIVSSLMVASYVAFAPDAGRGIMGDFEEV
jgi:hypothetical protein